MVFSGSWLMCLQCYYGGFYACLFASKFALEYCGSKSLSHKRKRETLKVWWLCSHLKRFLFSFLFIILAKTLIHFCFNFYVKYPQGTQGFDICDLGNNLLNFNENMPKRENSTGIFFFKFFFIESHSLLPPPVHRVARSAAQCDIRVARRERTEEIKTRQSGYGATL